MTDIPKQLLELFDPDEKEEVCGLITADGEILFVPNIHEEPTKGFRMDPQTMLDLMLERDVVATWHTHPQTDATLSQEDYAGFIQWPNLTHYIVADGEVRTYAVEDDLVLNV